MIFERVQIILILKCPSPIYPCPDRNTCVGVRMCHVQVKIPGKNAFADHDNGVRVATPEKLASLRPAFVRPHGTVTAANASFLTDGAYDSLQ